MMNEFQQYAAGLQCLSPAWLHFACGGSSVVGQKQNDLYKQAELLMVFQGEPGDQFYIIKEGEAVVYQQTPQGMRTVNKLFKADFFGERALLTQEPRQVLSGNRVRCVSGSGT